jgi:hypothetical protein
MNLKQYILYGVFGYFVVGLLWFINDRSAHIALKETRARWLVKRLSVILFIILWPYWLYLHIQLKRAERQALKSLHIFVKEVSKDRR